MLLRTIARMASTSTSAQGPIAAKMKAKLVENLQPTSLEILDESSKHAGHAAMKGLGPVESHFCLDIVSEKFSGKPLLARHRLVYDILALELKPKSKGGDAVHSIRFARLKSPAEIQS